jgi:YbbR domain-containing protein
MRIWPFRHFGLKVWSVAIATMLWMVVAGEQTVERGLRVPLELQQFPPGLELGADAPSVVDVRVRGSAGTLSRLGAGDVVGVIDLRTARAGRRLFQLTPEQVRVPFGVDVVQVAPQSIALSFEASATRIVPIVPALEGSPAAGYRVATTTVDPATVEVIGPESAVERVTEATTEPVSVADASRDVVDTVTVGFVDPSLRLRVVKPAAVTVRIVRAPDEEVLGGRQVRLRSTPRGLTGLPMPSVVNLILTGGRKALGNINPDSLVPWVDLSSLGPGEYTLTVHVEPAVEGDVVRVSPASVQVRVASDK